jgi:hypothetical protein
MCATRDPIILTKYCTRSGVLPKMRLQLTSVCKSVFHIIIASELTLMKWKGPTAKIPMMSTQYSLRKGFDSEIQ